MATQLPRAADGSVSIPEGFFVAWGFASYTDPEKLKGIIDGLKTTKPLLATNNRALKSALQDVYRARDGYRVEPLADKERNGYEVRRVVKGARKNDLPWLFRFYEDRSEALNVHADVDDATKDMSAITNRIQTQARRYKQGVRPDKMSEWLVAEVLIPHLHGLRMFPKGGLYFVPLDQEELLKNVVATIKQAAMAGSTTVTVQKISMTPTTAEAAGLAARHQFKHEVEALRARLNNTNMGQRALETKAAELKEIFTRVNRYAALLKTPFDEVTTLGKEIQDNLAKAIAEKKAEKQAAQVARDRERMKNRPQRGDIFWTPRHIW